MVTSTGDTLNGAAGWPVLGSTAKPLPTAHPEITRVVGSVFEIASGWNGDGPG